VRKLILIACLILPTTLLPAQDQNALLWKIESKNSDLISYVFGTMHSQDKRIFNLDSALIPLILRSELYVPEMDWNSDVQSKKLEKLVLPEGKTLKDLYSKEEYELIAREFDKQSSINIDDLQRLHPVALLMFIEGTSPYFLPLTLDEYLYNVAVSNKITTHGLETLEEQISFGIKSQDIRHVYKYFNERERFDSIANAVRLAYIAEDHQTMLKLTNDSEYTGFDISVLLDERNGIMTTRMDSILQHRKAFFAVGAAHLFGETGILAGLQKLGYKVTPVRNKKKMHQLIEFDIDWQDYKSFNNNFSIKFPPGQIDIRKVPGDNVFTRDYSHKGVKSMTFSINEKINPSFKSMDTETLSRVFLYQAQSSFAKNLGFSIVKTKHFKYNGRHATESLFSIDGTEMLVHARFVLAQDKLYMLFVMAKPNTEDLTSITQYMNSFTILN